MKPVFLALLLGLSMPSFAKTSTTLFICGGLEMSVAALNAVAAICSDAVRFNQTESVSKIETSLKVSTASYATSAVLMALAGAISILDSARDYAPGRTDKDVPGFITGISLGSVLVSMVGMVTSSIAFFAADEKNSFASMLGTSLGSMIANWSVFICALKWTYDMKVLAVDAPNV